MCILMSESKRPRQYATSFFLARHIGLRLIALSRMIIECWGPRGLQFQTLLLSIVAANLKTTVPFIRHDNRA